MSFEAFSIGRGRRNPVESINSLAPGRRGSHFKVILFKLIIQNSSFVTPCEIALSWMAHNFIDEK